MNANVDIPFLEKINHSKIRLTKKETTTWNYVKNGETITDSKSLTCPKLWNDSDADDIVFKLTDIEIGTKIRIIGKKFYLSLHVSDNVSNSIIEYIQKPICEQLIKHDFLSKKVDNYEQLSSDLEKPYIEQPLIRSSSDSPTKSFWIEIPSIRRGKKIIPFVKIYGPDDKTYQCDLIRKGIKIKYACIRISEVDVTDNIKFNAKLLEMRVKENGYTKLSNILLRSGVNCMTINDIFCMASKYGYEEIVRLMILTGANIHYNNDKALQNASSNGYVGMVTLLLESGKYTDASYKFAYTCALKNGHDRVAKLLNKFIK